MQRKRDLSFPKIGTRRMDKNIFETRCQEDPQGVIRDLVKQQTRQGVKIHELLERVKELESENTKLQKKLDKAEKKSQK